MQSEDLATAQAAHDRADAEVQELIRANAALGKKVLYCLYCSFRKGKGSVSYKGKGSVSYQGSFCCGSFSNFRRRLYYSASHSSVRCVSTLMYPNEPPSLQIKRSERAEMDIEARLQRHSSAIVSCA